MDTQGAAGIYCAIRTRCTQAIASFTSKSKADLEVRNKEGQWPQELACVRKAQRRLRSAQW
jgi:hypothetical protein